MQSTLKPNNQPDSLSLTSRSTLNWRYQIVSVLLFLIKVQWKLLLLIPMVGVACLYFPFWAGQQVKNGWQSDSSQLRS